jgi:hypothetical protein
LLQLLHQEVKLDLLQLLSQDGFSFAWAAATNSGEYKGPCPFCGGDDRLCVWPNLGNGGRYWCRQCEKHGDAIQYLRDFKDMSFRDGCSQLSISPLLSFSKSHRKSSTAWAPKKVKLPNSKWQESAQNYLDEAEKLLWREQNKHIRQWLHERGLKDETIRTARLGWHPQDSWEKRQLWGLNEKIQNGERKKLWLPGGLIIPYLFNDEILRLRVRRFGNADRWGRYIVVSGSSTIPMQFPGINSVFLVVESELDGLLISQDVSELTCVIALGSSQIRPDYELDQILKKASLLVIALDSDPTGATQTCRWWLKNYYNAVWWPIPLQYGKDPGEAFQKGFNLKDWVKAALGKYNHF